MRRIILGLVVTLVLGGAVLAATQAFFSDTETSTDNIFTAGSIDLTVDHAFASYNGDDCTEECTTDTVTNLLANGDFEATPVVLGDGWQVFPNGTAGLGWTVEWEPGQAANFGGFDRPEPKVEFHSTVNGWTHASGAQHAELDSDWFGPGNPNGEPALVYIYQNIPTEVGKKYELRWAFSPRPSTGAGENFLSVRIDDVEVDSNTAAGAGAPVWTEDVYTFTATAASTKIGFASGGPANASGTFLDNVRLHPVNCTANSVGGICNLWEEKDLTDNDIFWNFSDIKPGDYGRNVISLHVTDNDAYACLLIDDVVDDENVIIEPEASSGDVTDNPNGGELSSFIQAFAWNDLDQDGVYEPGDGETALYGPGNLFDLLDGIDVGDANSGSPLISGVTRYVGFTWCVGTMSLPGEAGMTCDGSSPTLNVAQTDIMTASVVAYAEQVRNNAGFECSNDLLGN